jgi:epoxyqueuosine reductase
MRGIILAASNSPAGAQRTMDLAALAAQVKAWGRDLGFQKVGIAGIALPEDERRLLEWLEGDRHGEMHYMARHGTRRSRPSELVPGTLRVISARMDYWPRAEGAEAVLADGRLGYISRYALGRDYHRVLRPRLARLADRLAQVVGRAGYRAFTDTAPVLEKALARDAGLGWIGKHTNLLDRHDGSWFFLGEVFTDVPLPLDAPVSTHCGSCTACLEVCPTRAIVAPYELDARRCISYLTIELAGPIPEEFRSAIGNRIYGCDDCQLVCPWNRYARLASEPDFAPRSDLDAPRLTELFAWNEAEFLARTEGSAIRRIGYVRWLRNVAIALGNAPPSDEVCAALTARSSHPSEMVRESVAWALARQEAAAGAGVE